MRIPLIKQFPYPLFWLLLIAACNSAEQSPADDTSQFVDTVDTVDTSEDILSDSSPNDKDSQITHAPDILDTQFPDPIADVTDITDMANLDGTSDTMDIHDTEPQRFTMEGRTWSLHEVDHIGGAPMFPDLTLSNEDQPVVVFRKGVPLSGSDMEYFSAISEFNGTQWSPVETVERVAEKQLGKRPSIVIDPTGRYHVVSYDVSEEQLRYSYRDPQQVEWTSAAITDTSVDAGDHSCLTVDPSGNVHLTYLQYTDYRVQYGLLADNQWTLYTIASEDGPVRGSSSSNIVDTSGTAHISFYGNGHLNYADGESDTWAVEVLDDSANQIGLYSSIALDAEGFAHIIYIRWPYTESAVKMASQNADGWQVETIEEDLEFTYTTGIAILPCGTTLVAYGRNRTDVHDLRFAYKLPDTDTWSILTVDDSTYVSGIDMVVEQNGQVHIIYFDETNYILKHARLL